MKKSRPVLKSYFETGDKPTEPQFSDLVDSLVHLDDGLFVTNVEKDDKGNQVITLSDGTSVTIQKPTVHVDQNNKIRIVDLGIIESDSYILKSTEDILAGAINRLDPPLVVKEDENVVFEFDVVYVGGEGEIFD